MRLQFFKEDTSWYAISELEAYKGMMCEELWWAEIEKIATGVEVRWEDDYKNPIPFENFSLAQTYIRENYSKHSPQIVGSRYEL